MSLFDGFLASTVGETVIDSKMLWRDNFQYSGPTQADTHLMNFPNLPAIQKHIVISKELSEEMSYLQEWDTCWYCHARYQRIDNLATHTCTYHPNPTSDPYTFGCCRVSKERPGLLWKGCTPCDHSPFNPRSKPHTPRWTKTTVFTRIPKAARHLLRFPDSSIVSEEHNMHDPVKSLFIVTRVQGFTLHDL
jgi:hypothetical protein